MDPPSRWTIRSNWAMSDSAIVTPALLSHQVGLPGTDFPDGV
jgi:hypothetical protein